jgi:hypothetical protein
MSEPLTHKHHRKMRSQGGGGHPANILKVSPDLHDMIHAHPAVAYEYGLLVKSYDDPAEIDVDIPGFLAKLGKEHDHEGTCTFCGEELHVKPKRPRLKGDDLAKRKTVTIKLPEGTDGADWEDLLAEAETVEQAQDDTQYEQWRGGIAKGKLLVAVLERFTGRAG